MSEPTEQRINEIIAELRTMQNAAQVVLDSGFGTHEGEHDVIYRKRRDLAKDAADALESLQREREQSGWIPCSERLPEEHEQAYPVYDETTFAVIDARCEMISDVCAVTVKDSKGSIFSAADFTVNGKWETYEIMEEDHTVLAWQPLPAPWSGEVKEA